MCIMDYLRLGFAGIKAHKGRASIVVLVVGILFSVVIAGAFVLQGLESSVMSRVSEPTNGKILLVSTVDMQICGENCDIKAEVKQIKANIAKYGGEEIPTDLVRNTNRVFYRLKENVFTNKSVDLPDDVTEVVVPIEMAAQLSDIEIPKSDVEARLKLRAIEDIYGLTLRKIVKNKIGERYYIAQILPSNHYANNLSFQDSGQSFNPLDVILSQIQPGESQDFITRPAKVKKEIDKKNRPSGLTEMDDVATEEEGVVLATFSDFNSAYNYYKDKNNYCTEMDWAFGECNKDYKYQTTSAVLNPIAVYESIQNMWMIFNIVAIVLVVIATIVAWSTYARLISKDVKIISLYYTMGAGKKQVRLIYIVYSLLLSLMAVVFSIIIGFALAWLLSWANQSFLTKAFTLGFGIPENNIWLVGWNNLVWLPIAAIISVAIISVVLSNGSFKTNTLAKKIK